MSGLQEAVMRAWYIRTGTILQTNEKRDIEECRKNVTRCNRAKKLSYCIVRR